MDYQSQLALDARRRYAIDAAVDERLVFLRKTYMLVFLGLAVSTLGGWLGVTRLLPLFAGGGFGRYLLLFLVFVGSFVAARALRMKPGINYVAMFGFTFIAGVTLAPLLWFALLAAKGEPTIILQAVAVTGVVVAGLSGYVLLTKRDFDYLRGALSIGLFALVGMLIVGFFVGSFTFHLLISGAGALLFAGFVLYDTSRIVRKHPVNDSVGAALGLFLDFFLLFEYVLRLLIMLAMSRD